MSSFTLDDIRAAADAKYASTDITVGDTVCVLVNPLRLPKERRDALMRTQETISSNEGEAEVDEAKQLRDALRLVCKNDYQADVLLGAIGDDLALLAMTFEKYTAGAELGEASASAA